MTVLADPLVHAAMARFPGAEVVDVRPPLPPDVASGAAASDAHALPVTMSLGEAQQEAINEACRIRETQARLVRDGVRAVEHLGEMRRAACFDFLARLVDRVKADKEILARLRGGAS